MATTMNQPAIVNIEDWGINFRILKVGAKSLSQPLFKQIPFRPIVNDDVQPELLGRIIAKVNAYWDKGLKTEHSFGGATYELYDFHIIWEYKGELFRWSGFKGYNKSYVYDANDYICFNHGLPSNAMLADKQLWNTFLDELAKAPQVYVVS